MKIEIHYQTRGFETSKPPCDQPALPKEDIYFWSVHDDGKVIVFTSLVDQEANK